MTNNKEPLRDAFGRELHIDKEQVRRDIERMLQEKPKEKTLERGKFNLDKMYGPGMYVDVAKQIESDGLLTPTMAETASLVHDAFFGKIESKYQDQIKGIMKDKWLWAFTGILYAPSKGAYIQDNPEIRNGMSHMEESELVKKLQKNDSSVRFVPFGYEVKSMTPKELEKNAFVIGPAGKEGAKKLAEVAGKYKENPYLWSFESVNGPTTRVSAVYSWLDDRRLVVSGYGRGDSRGGCAFGVQKNTRP